MRTMLLLTFTILREDNWYIWCLDKNRYIRCWFFSNSFSARLFIFCIIILFIELHLFIPLVMTLTWSKEYRGIKNEKLLMSLNFRGKFMSYQIETVCDCQMKQDYHNMFFVTLDGVIFMFTVTAIMKKSHPLSFPFYFASIYSHFV